MRPLDENARMTLTGFQGRRRDRGGGGTGRGCGQLICYNCGGPGLYAHDCNNPMCSPCKYCILFDHETEDCLTPITRIRDKGVLPPPPTRNLQMMRFEPHEEDPNVNIVLQSGIAMIDDKGK